MTDAIDLDHQARCRAIEVNDAAADRVLASEL
jgi:hypothetical protein